MSGDQNFQQRWGLRGKDDADSSSDESKSCSQDHVLKKHRLVMNFETAENENDAISNDPKKRKSSKPRKKRKESPAIINKKKKTKRNPKKKSDKTKNTRGKFKPISLDGLKIFTKSIIDELKIAREEMFARMSEEMNVISNVISSPGHGKKKDGRVDEVGKEPSAKKVELVKKARKSNGASLKKPIRSDKSKDSSKSCEIIEDEVIRDKNLGLTVNEKTKVKPSNMSQKEPIHNVSSPYLSLPSVSANKSGISVENAAFRNDEMLPQMGYFSGTQMPEQFQNVSQMGFQNTSYYNNQMRNRTPSMGFSGTLHPGMRNGGFSFANQVMDNSSRGNDMRFLGGNNGYFGNYVGNSSGKSD